MGMNWQGPGGFNELAGGEGERKREGGEGGGGEYWRRKAKGKRSDEIPKGR